MSEEELRKLIPDAASNEIYALFDTLITKLFVQERNIAALHKVAMSHIDRFSAVYKFADATGSAMNDTKNGLHAISDAIEDLAKLCNSMAYRIEALERTSTTQKVWN